MTSRAFLSLAAVVALSGCAEVICDCVPPDTEFDATLSGDCVVPPVTTNASAEARFELTGSWSDEISGNWTAMRYEISATDLPAATTARLYRGSPGYSGTAAMTLCDPCNPSAGSLRVTDVFQIDAAFLNTIRSYGFFLEVSTASGPLLRGQVRRIP